MVKKLKENGIVSLYHKKNNLKHGNEKHPTFFMYRNIEKPYHIDYCFTSEKILKNGFDFSIGKTEDWIELSDHIPISIIINKINQNKIVNSLALGLTLKFEELLPATKEKFGITIEGIIEQAKLIDRKGYSEKNNKNHIKIIEDAEKIIQIDRIIRQMNDKELKNKL